MMSNTIWARHALTEEGWQQNVRVEVEGGTISSVTADGAPAGDEVGVLLPAPANLHSHAFQRAMAGLTERRGPDPRDSFWTWRKLMYRFLNHLSPDDVEAITAFVFMQMAEAGYGAAAEFHYLHHQPDGTPYGDIGEMSVRVAAAAEATGLGLTLLPVLYQYGGCDARELGPGQIRFGNDEDQFAKLFQRAQQAVIDLPDDCNIGTAPHSLRAVDLSGINTAASLADSGPIHIHVAEQIAEVEEVQQYLHARPAEWLLNTFDVNSKWCFIHGTQMFPEEIIEFAATGATLGLCPITESSLGDGIFDARTLMNANGAFGIGSDSNIRISLSEELRLLEFTQRLRHRERAVFAQEHRSTGRVIFEGAASGGARALNRNSGTIAPGKLADLVSLRDSSVDLENKQGDVILDSYIFAADDGLVADVWSAGRHIVKNGQHIDSAGITARYRQTISDLVQVI